jgi:hypothetical protein
MVQSFSLSFSGRNQLEIPRVVLPSALLQDGPGTPSQTTSPTAKSKAKAELEE